MKIVYTGEEAPRKIKKSIFLAGPTPRSAKVRSWRPEAIQILEASGYDGIVFVPEFRDGGRVTDYVAQVEWEERYLNMADCILFWIPRKMKTMPALTTNNEWGAWCDSGKVVFGAPADAEKVDYQKHYAKKLCVPASDTLEGVAKTALDMIGDGGLRTDGEREVPLYIWKNNSFQKWYEALRLAGNRLDGARVKWVCRVGKNKDIIFCWALHVNVYVAIEKRNKVNEVVISRPDTAMIVMYRKDEIAEDSDIVLIREFRSPVSNQSGFVWEVPGGSSFKSEQNALDVIVAECLEETSFKISDPSRIRVHEARQLAATFSGHRAYLFSMEITRQDLEYMKSQKGVPHGNIGDSEMTYVEVVKLKDILNSEDVDWSVLGMILSVLK